MEKFTFKIGIYDKRVSGGSIIISRIGLIIIGGISIGVHVILLVFDIAQGVRIISIIVISIRASASGTSVLGVMFYLLYFILVLGVILGLQLILCK